MSILNVNQIQPVGSGQTVTISATNISAGSATVTAGTFTGNLTGNVTGNATGLSGSPTLSGITSVSTSNLTVNGTAYPNAGPLSNRNLIINGAMQIYQRSGISTNIIGYHLDRWEFGASGGTRAVTQETLTTGSPYDEGFRNYFHLINTGASTASNSYREITQKIEAQNVANSGWNYTSSDSFVTLSFWVRSSVAQTYYVKLKTNDGTAQAYGSAFSLSADTWTKVTKTIPGNSNITINNDNGNGLNVAVVPFYGTDFTDNSFVTDAWATYVDPPQLPDMTNTWAGTTNATFDLTGVQLEVGSVATPFEHRSYGDELARCQRYYYKISGASNDRYFMGLAENSTVFYGVMHAPVTMRTDPTLETSGTASHFRVSYSTDTTCNAVPTLANSTPNTALIGGAIVASGLTANQAAMLGSNSASSYLALTAEL